MMSPRQWTDKVYNAGYTDARHGRDKLESFNDDMRIGAMEEWYERGWTDGVLDSDRDNHERRLKTKTQ